ncbi:hypothetical protein G9A89_013574 [Geosiphon pyriformis]|nr:hypothetical protein G9A89_013574 [Geosiphon pyriformis]
MEPQHNYYETLEVSPNASLEEIKKAYRKLALKYHPDKHRSFATNLEIAVKQNNLSINDRFILINEAYSTLNNVESRSRYDIQLRRGGDYGKQMHEFETQEEFENYRKLQLIHVLFREIMANKERISEIGDTFLKFAVQFGWIVSNKSAEEGKDEVGPIINAYEREITAIESSILLEPDDNLFGTNFNDCHDDDLTQKYLPEDDIIQILDTPHWILIDKESLITNYQMSEISHSHRLLILAVTNIVSPLMMAV